MRLTAPTLLVLAILLAACGDTQRVGESARESTTWLALEEDLRIGSLDDPDEAFGIVTWLRVGPDGRVYSHHFGDSFLRRWTPDGEPDGQVGRAGEGPGEFEDPRTFGFFGDTLWVMDIRRYRVTFMDGDGMLLGTVSPPVNIGRDPNRPDLPAARPVRPLRDGTFLAITPGFSSRVASGDLTEAPAQRVSVEGQLLQEFWSMPYRPSDVFELTFDGGGGRYANQPFEDSFRTEMDSFDRYIVLNRRIDANPDSPEYSLTKIALETGDTIWHRPVPYQPVPVTEARADSAIAARAASWHPGLSEREAGLTLASLEARVRESTFIPDYLPPVEEIAVSATDQIWVRSFLPTSDGHEWTVFDTEGNPIATVLTPTDVAIRWITAEHVWGSVTDELDVPYIVRYPIQRESR